MSVMTTTHSQVQVNASARSVTWTGNQLLRVLLETFAARGLPISSLQTQLERIAKDLFIWLALECLESVKLEVYRARTGELVDKFEHEIGYATSFDGEERFETDIKKLREGLKQLAPRPGCKFR